MQEWSVAVWLAVGAIAAVVLAVAALAVLCVVTLRRVRERSAEEAAVARAEAETLRARIDQIERRLSESTPGDAGDRQEFVITRLGDEPAIEAVSGAGTIPGPLFADLVLRESVVQAGSFAAGLRRALAPEVRNRIRFEMRREVKRARKQRRTDLRQARREWEARQRAAEPAEDSAA